MLLHEAGGGERSNSAPKVAKKVFDAMKALKGSSYPGIIFKTFIVLDAKPT